MTCDMTASVHRTSQRTPSGQKLAYSKTGRRNRQIMNKQGPSRPYGSSQIQVYRKRRTQVHRYRYGCTRGAGGRGYRGFVKKPAQSAIGVGALGVPVRQRDTRTSQNKNIQRARGELLTSRGRGRAEPVENIDPSQNRQGQRKITRHQSPRKAGEQGTKGYRRGGGMFEFWSGGIGYSAVVENEENVSSPKHPGWWRGFEVRHQFLGDVCSEDVI